jgi:hypothetical protein
MLTRRCLVLLTTLAAINGFRAALAHETEDDVILFQDKTPDGRPRALRMEEIRTLPRAALTTRTPWYDSDVRFEGVLARDLMEYAGAVQGEASIAAIDGSAIKIPLADFAANNAIFAYRADGTDLTVATRGPLFLVYPFDDKPELANETYYSRCIGQIARITIG